MVLKEEVWEEKPTVNRVLVSQCVIGCDNCQKEIGQPGEGLSLSVFKPDYAHSEEFTYCCWACVAEGVSKIKDAEFATLPYLQFDAEVWKDGQHVSDFLKLCGK